MNRRQAQIRIKLMLMHALSSSSLIPRYSPERDWPKWRLGDQHNFIHSLIHLKICQRCARPCTRPQELVGIKRHSTAGKEKRKPAPGSLQGRATEGGTGDESWEHGKRKTSRSKQPFRVTMFSLHNLGFSTWLFNEGELLAVSSPCTNYIVDSYQTLTITMVNYQIQDNICGFEPQTCFFPSTPTSPSLQWFPPSTIRTNQKPRSQPRFIPLPHHPAPNSHPINTFYSKATS